MLTGIVATTWKTVRLSPTINLKNTKTPVKLRNLTTLGSLPIHLYFTQMESMISYIWIPFHPELSGGAFF